MQKTSRMKDESNFDHLATLDSEKFRRDLYPCGREKVISFNMIEGIPKLLSNALGLNG